MHPIRLPKAAKAWLSTWLAPEHYRDIVTSKQVGAISLVLIGWVSIGVLLSIVINHATAAPRWVCLVVFTTWPFCVAAFAWLGYVSLWAIMRLPALLRTGVVALWDAWPSVNRGEVQTLQQYARPELMYQMGDVEFEEFVLRYFHCRGYRVLRTKKSGDGGIDGIMRCRRRRYFVQCKRWVNPVGEPPVRDFLGAITKARADGGFFVTTSCFTRAAQKFAMGSTIVLVDGWALAHQIRLLKRRPKYWLGRNKQELDAATTTDVLDTEESLTE